MVGISSDLAWQLTRDNNSKMLKQKNLPIFTRDRTSLTGFHSQTYSGYCNSKVVGLTLEKSGKKDTIVLTTSTRQSRQNKPKKSLQRTAIDKCQKKGMAKIFKQLAGKTYRRDLVAAAQKKYQVILKTFKKPTVQKTPNRKVVAKAEE